MNADEALKTILYTAGFMLALPAVWALVKIAIRFGHFETTVEGLRVDLNRNTAEFTKFADKVEGVLENHAVRLAVAEQWDGTERRGRTRHRRAEDK